MKNARSLTLPALLAALATTAPGQTWSALSDGVTSGLAESPTGGYFASYSNSPLIRVGCVKFDANGDVVWQRYLDEAYSAFLRGVVATADGGAYVYGDEFDALSVWRFDSTGSFVYQTFPTGFVDAGTARAGVATSDGGAAFVGYELLDYGGYNKRDALLLRLEPDGTTRFLVRLSDGGPNDLTEVEGTDVVELDDGSLVVVGENDQHLWAARVSSTGTLMWHLEFESGWPYQYAEVIENMFGNVLIAAGGFGIGVAELDSQGSLVYAAEGADQVTLTGLAPHPTGIGGVFTGRYLQDPFIFRLYAGGVPFWARRYEQPGTEFFRDVSVTSTGLAVSGGLQGTLLVLNDSGLGVSCAPVDEPIQFTQKQPVLTPDPNFQVLTHGTIEQDLGVPLHSNELFPKACYGRPGTKYCSPATDNSTGGPASIHVVGANSVDANVFTAVAEGMPSNQSGYFLTGQGNGQVQPPGSQGVLCLTGTTIFRFAKQVQNTGGGGTFQIGVDLGAIPGHGAILSGETWNWQAWFRDQNPGTTSNFTDALAVTFF